MTSPKRKRFSNHQIVAMMILDQCILQCLPFSQETDRRAAAEPTAPLNIKLCAFSFPSKMALHFYPGHGAALQRAKEQEHFSKAIYLTSFSSAKGLHGFRWTLPVIILGVITGSRPGHTQSSHCLINIGSCIKSPSSLRPRQALLTDR